MEKISVSQEFLAELARNNSNVLNQKPLINEEYNIVFKDNGQTFRFSHKDGYWNWSFE